MKKIIIILISLAFVLCSCSISENNAKETTIRPFSQEKTSYHKTSVFITYYELQKLIDGRNESEFEKNVLNAFNELKDMGFNTITVQVRAFADAFYKSNYFPLSRYCFGEEGGELKYDVLKIICSAAEKIDLNVEAWVNPYRISFSSDINKLSDNNIAKKWFKNKKTKSRVYICKKGIYFNPASDDVIRLIRNGVFEIAENYPVSAVMIDDYFYPETNKKIDKKEYSEYRKGGGKSSLDDFRRDKVSMMVEEANKAVKKANSAVLFGISPASDINNNYKNLFADTEKWAKDSRYCDFICPQIYFGFKNVYQPFMFTVKKWLGFSKNELYVALPLYKCSKKDKYAAIDDKSAINEFKNNKNIIARQITYLAKIDDIKGVYIFSYSSLFDEKASEEVKNMKEALQSKYPFQNHRS